METKKIAIVGGGICGLYLGWKLSLQGHRIVIFERKKEIGQAVCSGLFSRSILDFIPSSETLIQNRIKSAILHFPKKSVQLRFNRESYVMEHSELDKLVADLCLKSGAEILFENNIKNLPSGFDRIIGCDGADSAVRKALGISSPELRLGIKGTIKEEDFSDVVETWPCHQGFIWRIPRGTQVEWGIIAGLNSAKKIFDEFLRNRNIVLLYKESKIIPQGFLIPKNQQITLCGDAAGLTKPWSGGGVIWGLKAADILLKNFPDFLVYRNAAQKFFLPKIFFSKICVKAAYFLGFKMPWFLGRGYGIDSDFLIK